MTNKLIITSRKYKGESMVVSARISNELVKKIDKLAEDTGRTRNDIIQMCLEFAIDNIEVEK